MSKQLIQDFSSGVKRFFSGIFLSRISGMGRDLAMAYAFGDHPTVAAFMVAFRFSNLLRRFFGEGPLQSAFIPHFEGLRAECPAQAYTFFRKLTFLLIIVLSTLTLLTQAGIGGALHLFNLSGGNREILQLTSSLMPCLFFICLYGINISLLQCHNAFFIPSVAPFICNLAWIAGAISLKGMAAADAMPLLAKWVVIGFVLQWLMTLPLIKKKVPGKVKEWFKPSLHPEVKRLAKSFSLGALGVGAIQINAFLDAIFARAADLRGPVYLWYSIRFQQLALAIFGIAAVSTLVPLLSRAIKKGEIEKGKEIFAFGFRRVLTLMLSSTLAIFVLGYFAIDLIYGHGNFSSHAVSETTYCFWAYSLGLIPAALIMLSSAVFYAEGNFRTPTFIALGTVGTSITLNTLFVFGLKLGPVSTALSTSISSWINFLLLNRLLHAKGFSARYSLREFIPLLAGGVFASFLAYGVDYLFFPMAGVSHGVHQMLRFLMPAGAFVLGLFAFAYFLKNRDLLSVFRAFLTRRQ